MSLVQPNNSYSNSEIQLNDQISSSQNSIATKSSIPNSTSLTTLSLLTNSNNNNNNQIEYLNQVNQTPKNTNNISISANSNTPASSTNSFTRNHSNSNLLNSNGIPETEDTCTITSALKHYLIRLKEPLMTFSYNQQFLNACRKCN
jgi:hypothetical protein